MFTNHSDSAVEAHSNLSDEPVRLIETALRKNIVQEPTERFAFETLSNFQPFADIASHASRIGNHRIEDFLVIIKPNVGCACHIMVDGLVFSSWVYVWRIFSEYVSDSGA